MAKFEIGESVKIIGLRQYENKILKIIHIKEYVNEKNVYTGTIDDGKFYVFDITEDHLESLNKESRFKVGDRVRIIDNNFLVTEIFDTQDDYGYNVINCSNQGELTWTMGDHEVELVAAKNVVDNSFKNPRYLVTYSIYDKEKNLYHTDESDEQVFDDLKTAVDKYYSIELKEDGDVCTLLAFISNNKGRYKTFCIAERKFR